MDSPHPLILPLFCAQEPQVIEEEINNIINNNDPSLRSSFNVFCSMEFLGLAYDKFGILFQDEMLEVESHSWIEEAEPHHQESGQSEVVEEQQEVFFQSVAHFAVNPNQARSTTSFALSDVVISVRRCQAQIFLDEEALTTYKITSSSSSRNGDDDDDDEESQNDHDELTVADCYVQLFVRFVKWFVALSPFAFTTNSRLYLRKFGNGCLFRFLSQTIFPHVRSFSSFKSLSSLFADISDRDTALAMNSSFFFHSGFSYLIGYCPSDRKYPQSQIDQLKFPFLKCLKNGLRHFDVRYSTSHPSELFFHKTLLGFYADTSDASCMLLLSEIYSTLSLARGIPCSCVPHNFFCRVIKNAVRASGDHLAADEGNEASVIWCVVQSLHNIILQIDSQERGLPFEHTSLKLTPLYDEIGVEEAHIVMKVYLRMNDNTSFSVDNADRFEHVLLCSCPEYFGSSLWRDLVLTTCRELTSMYSFLRITRLLRVARKFVSIEPTLFTSSDALNEIAGFYPAFLHQKIYQESNRNLQTHAVRALTAFIDTLVLQSCDQAAKIRSSFARSFEQSGWTYSPIRRLLGVTSLQQLATINLSVAITAAQQPRIVQHIACETLLEKLEQLPYCDDRDRDALRSVLNLLENLGNSGVPFLGMRQRLLDVLILSLLPRVFDTSLCCQLIRLVQIFAADPLNMARSNPFLALPGLVNSIQKVMNSAMLAVISDKVSEFMEEEIYRNPIEVSTFCKAVISFFFQALRGAEDVESLSEAALEELNRFRQLFLTEEIRRALFAAASKAFGTRANVMGFISRICDRFPAAQAFFARGRRLREE